MKKTFLFLFLSLSLFSASAKVFSVKATLNEANVVPNYGISTHTGELVGTFNDVTNVLSFTLSFTMNSIDPLTFHEAPAGVNAPSFETKGGYGTPSPISGTLLPFPPARVTNLMSGNIYVLIKTVSFPDGEIRGQLIVSELETFTSANINDFYAIGGYSYLEGDFPVPLTLLTSPYVRSGPLPNNDFTFVATSPLNLAGRDGRLTTNTTNQAITLTFKGNNVRKMRAFVRSENVSASTTSGTITATATTNLGNSANVVGSGSSPSVGFRVLNENEYIVQVVFSAPSDGQFTTLDNIMIGDDTPQNVSLNFDGVNDNIALPSTVGNFATNAAFTVTCWVKPALSQVSLANTDNDILEKWDGVAGAYPFVIRYLNSGADAGKILARRYDGGTLTSTVLISGSSINDGNWHHIAFVREAGGTLKLYIDGSLSNSDPDLSQNSTTNNSPLYIGSRNTINHFKGEIDEVRIWTVGKTQTEIQDEMFCKNPNTTNLQAAYNFNNGVPNGNNILISQIRDAVGSNHGVFAPVFAKTGDVSNFVTGQVKYVKANAAGLNNGSSWANAFSDLQSALPANTCNDLFDVYVATGTYKPHSSNINTSFDIPVGMKIYGGFSGTEKNINERNMALIHSTNQTTLSGDLANNDILSDYSQNRGDNSKNVVKIQEKSNILIDGFGIRGGFGAGYGGGINIFHSQNIYLKNCKIFDNHANFGGGMSVVINSTMNASNCTFLGNKGTGYGDALHYSAGNTVSISMNNCVVAGHIGNQAILAEANGTGILTHSYTNCTFVNNNRVFTNQTSDDQNNQFGTINFSLKNSIIYGNTNNNEVNNSGGTYNESITYSLVQGVTVGTGNLNGNTTNPQFVNLPVPGVTPSTGGDYHLKWCSLAIGAGTNSGISPLDLDRNPRNFNGTADMGAYEFLGNTPSQVNNSTITGTIDSPTYAGGAIQTITSTAKILAPAGAIDFKAPNAITLNPGFEARGVGKYFQAQIGANVGCVNP